nr:uncharacterized protein CI109_005719 [Kwoniella shandongensis]KAA5525971.1 hypothetical protein CI109_005719 [Kwoniella shandongensis]
MVISGLHLPLGDMKALSGENLWRCSFLTGRTPDSEYNQSLESVVGDRSLQAEKRAAIKLEQKVAAAKRQAREMYGLIADDTSARTADSSYMRILHAEEYEREWGHQRQEILAVDKFHC